MHAHTQANTSDHLQVVTRYEHLSTPWEEFANLTNSYLLNIIIQLDWLIEVSGKLITVLQHLLLCFPLSFFFFFVSTRISWRTHLLLWLYSTMFSVWCFRAFCWKRFPSVAEGVFFLFPFKAAKNAVHQQIKLTFFIQSGLQTLRVMNRNHLSGLSS